MKRLLLRAVALWLLAGAKLAAAGPIEAIKAAEIDAGKLPPVVAYATRYLWVPHADERQEVFAAASFWANSTSTEAEIVRPRLVGAEVIALYLPAYGGNKAALWEKFGDTDPYFHERVAVPAGQAYTSFWRQGKSWTPGFYAQRADKALVFSIPVRSMEQDRLAILCNSAAPILRADWWLNQVAAQVDRKVGYYDWLGAGAKRADFEKVVGLDRAAAARVRRETAAIVTESIVALHNRQIFRRATITGAWWETNDSKKNTDVNNAIRLLDEDYRHDAEEIIATLPNGLHGFFLAAADGTRADFAPDTIASDGSSPSSDRRVHAGISCVRCHVEGIRPINDWARRAYNRPFNTPDSLTVPDPVREVRLRQLYASDLGKLIKRDQGDYVEAVRATNGLDTADNAKVVAAVWYNYQDRPVTAEVAAAELGVTPEAMLAVFRMRKGIDPVLFSLAKRPSIPVRREYWEEIFQVAWSIIREAN